MNREFHRVAEILERLKADYVASCDHDVRSPDAPVTERDIVADIRFRMQDFCRSKGLYAHCEIKPVPIGATAPEDLKPLPRIDVAILCDMDGISWLEEAKKLQNGYKKGEVEARFSSVPVRFFHTAIEVKIQSNVDNAKKDINTLAKIRTQSPSCNCFFVLLNARGIPKDHEKIAAYGAEKGIHVVEHTCRKSRAGHAADRS
jgi:hypothetical protein